MIFCADLHLRDDQPKARIDNYFSAQERKFRAILALARSSLPLIIAGDFFHRPRPSLSLIRWVMDLLYEYDVIPLIVPGQHDLPYHNLEYLPSSGLGILEVAGRIDLIDGKANSISWTSDFFGDGRDYTIVGVPFGELPPEEGIGNKLKKILIWHHLIIKKNEELWPGQVSPIAGKILREYKEFDIIVTGDNHRTFLEKSGKRFLVNPGSMMRMTADQADHKPCVFELRHWKHDGSPALQKHYLPIEDNVLDRSHIDTKQERDERIDSFIQQLKTDYEVGVSFDRNLEEFFRQNNVREPVKSLIRENM